MELIDTHTHLYLKEFESDIDQVINKSKDIGIIKFIFPSIHSKYNDRMIDTYNKDRSIFNIMAGLHPAYVSNKNDKEIDTTDQVVIENNTYHIGFYFLTLTNYETGKYLSLYQKLIEYKCSFNFKLIDIDHKIIKRINERLNSLNEMLLKWK